VQKILVGNRQKDGHQILGQSAPAKSWVSQGAKFCYNWHHLCYSSYC